MSEQRTYTEAEIAAMLGTAPVEAAIPASPMQELKTQMGPSAWETAGQLIQEYAPAAGELAGALGGGIAGAKRGATWQPIPQLKVPSAVIGGVAGAMAGRGAGEVAADLAGDEVDAVDTVTNMLEAGAFEALGAGAFSLVAKGVEAIRKVRIGGQLSQEEAQALNQVNEMLKNSGATVRVGGKDVPVQLTPAQVTNSPLKATLERIAVAGYGGEGVQRLYIAQGEALKKIFDQTKRTFGRTGEGARESLGKAYQSAIEQVEQELVAWAKPKYAELDKLAKGASLSTQSIEQAVRMKLVGAGQNLRPNVGKTASIADLMTMTTRLPKKVEKLYQDQLLEMRNINFSNAFDRVEKLSAELRTLKAKASRDKNLEREYVKVIGMWHKTMETQAKRMGGNLYDEYKGLNEFYREGIRSVRSEGTKQLMAAAPEFVGETAAREGNVTLVKDLLASIDDAAALSAKMNANGKPSINAEQMRGDFKAGYLDVLFKDIMSEMTDSASDKASVLLGKLREDNNVRDTFNAVLTKPERARVLQAVSIAESLEKQAGGNFSLMVRGKQTQAGTSLVKSVQQGSVLGAGASVVGGPVTTAIMTGVAIGLLTAPPLIARSAAKGDKTAKLLAEAMQLVKKSETKNWDPVRDGGALVFLAASLPLRNEDLPPEWREEDIPASEVLLEKLFESAK